ncbi:MAG TPA: PepSY-associated TM helix domain-containing protein [Saprospiraceae bacterium]|nr:PepSY-associated TM helix domain-containing protein [Saprospiraceae bacterium]HMQ81482.1 PepSY-associated TM helix domain-containing protein [Saprospiraceae bacterium]
MDRKQHTNLLRLVRKIHRSLGIFLFALFLVIALTGILLGWKKHSSGYLLPDTQKGTSSDLSQWLPLDSLNQIADRAILEKLGQPTDLSLNRIDIRKDKGSAKFLYAHGYWEVQVDGKTGTVLGLNRRRSDWLEQVHDGSIVDAYFQIGKGYIKLIYTSLMGLSLLTFSLTGFWLWYGPKWMRKIRQGS